MRNANIHEKQARYFLHVLFERFPTSPRRQRRPALFPAVTDQSKPRITQRPFGWRRKQHCLPTLVLVDIKWALIQTVSNRRCEAEITILLEASGNVGASQCG
jgi:hypothetical protein